MTKYDFICKAQDATNLYYTQCDDIYKKITLQLNSGVNKESLIWELMSDYQLSYATCNDFVSWLSEPETPNFKILKSDTIKQGDIIESLGLGYSKGHEILFYTINSLELGGQKDEIVKDLMAIYRISYGMCDDLWGWINGTLSIPKKAWRCPHCGSSMGSEVIDDEECDVLKTLGGMAISAVSNYFTGDNLTHGMTPQYRKVTYSVCKNCGKKV